MQWSLEALAAVTDGIVIVLPAGDVATWTGGEHQAVAGGATRSASVRAGLASIPNDAEIVLVHDAARPFASAALGKAVIKAIEDGADAAIPGIPVSDTIKRVDTTTLRVKETVDRANLYAVQTPQGFRASTLRKAHAEEADASDDAAVVERIGGMVVIVPGESKNMKITVADDLAIAHVLIEARAARATHQDGE